MEENLSKQESENRMRAALRFYRLLHATQFLSNTLNESGLWVCVLKGCDLAGFYEIPEYRQFGDVDLLLLNPSQKEEAIRILKENGCVQKEEQDSHHHVEFLFQGKVPVELHVSVSRAFDSKKVNQAVAECFTLCKEDLTERTVCGVSLPVMKEGKYGVYLILHMLQHFLNAGFGERLLIDWKQFLLHGLDDKQWVIFLTEIEKLGLGKFTRIVTRCTLLYEGLEERFAKQILLQTAEEGEENETAKKLYAEILSAGRFGEGRERVVTMRSDSVLGMVREFHHQTKENFPRASKVFLIWPILWVYTFFRFIRNNKRVRNVSTKAVLESAKNRARLSKELKIWSHD